MYKIIDLETYPKRKNYEWFRKFSNPCYGFNVKMDVTKVVAFSKRTKTSFFINVLYMVTKGCSSVEEMRLRYVNGEIRLYDVINPTFTVMTNTGVFENTGFTMIDDYQGFYQKAYETKEKVKNQTDIKRSFNDNKDYSDYYMTCIPWLSLESMIHPIPDNDYESCSCPRINWDKYREENGRYVMCLNITVNHMFVDGNPLSRVFKTIQEYFDDVENFCK
jgi:chloramphenicol O-acetyltransferase type A